MEKQPGSPPARAANPGAVKELEDQSLPRTHRLRKRGEIKRVQDKGLKLASGALLLMLQPTDRGYRRLGVTVSSKTGNAVVRARVKRLFREIFRKNRALLPESVDVVLIARAGAKDASLAKLSADFARAADLARKKLPRPGKQEERP